MENTHVLISIKEFEAMKRMIKDVYNVVDVDNGVKEVSPDMSSISEAQYKSLTKSIFLKLIECDSNGLGELGECRDESERIVTDWMEAENIVLIEIVTP